jgi:hypothetical protein
VLVVLIPERNPQGQISDFRFVFFDIYDFNGVFELPSPRNAQKLD